MLQEILRKVTHVNLTFQREMFENIQSANFRRLLLRCLPCRSRFDGWVQTETGLVEKRCRIKTGLYLVASSFKITIKTNCNISELILDKNTVNSLITKKYKAIGSLIWNDILCHWLRYL